MNRNELKLYKESLSFSVEQHEILIGKLLGDATIAKQLPNRLHNIKFEQANKDYVDHLYLIFRDWVGTPPSIRPIKGGKASDRFSFWFRTYRHKLISDLYFLFYCSGRKIVLNSIDKLITVRSLAYWFMDDGHRTKKNSYYLNTHGFTYDENLFLSSVLLNNFGIKSTVQRDKSYYRLYICADSTILFTTLIRPYLIKSMFYKLI